MVTMSWLTTDNTLLVQLSLPPPILSSESEFEHFRHSLREICFSHRDLNLNGGQFHTRRFLAENVREHPIALKQVAQRSFGIAGLGEKAPCRSTTTLDDFLTESGRRKQPDGASRNGEERLDQTWQQPESLCDDSWLTRESEKVFDDHVETLTLKPVECLEHFRRRSVHPSLIHVHRHEPVQQRRVFRCAPPGVIRHHLVGRVNTQTVLNRDPTSDGRLPRTAPTADPVDVFELLPKRRTAGSLFVLSG